MQPVPRNYFGLDTGEFDHLTVEDNNPLTKDALIEDLWCQTLAIGSGATVNTITTNMNTSSDSKLPTEKAVVDYVAGHSGSVPVPLHLLSTSNPQLYTEYDVTHYATLGANANGWGYLNASGGIVNVAATSVCQVLNATASSSKGTGALVTNGGLSTAKTSYMDQVIIDSTAGPQLKIQHDAVSLLELYVAPGGNCFITAGSSKPIYFGSANQINSLNATASSSVGTGSIVTAGGISAIKASYMAEVRIVSPNQPQLTLGYDSANHLDFYCSPIGNSQLAGPGGKYIAVAALNDFRVLNETDATTVYAASTVISGGVGIAKQLRVGGAVTYAPVWRIQDIPYEIGVAEMPVLITFNTTVRAYEFSKTTTNTVFLNYAMPRDYYSGSTAYLEVDWCPATVDLGDVYMNIQNSMCAVGDVTGGSLNTQSYTVAVPGVANRMVRTQIITMSYVPDAIGFRMFVKFSRLGGNAGDTYDGVIRLLGFRMRYQSVTTGDSV